MSETLKYFAYGSNLHPVRLRQRTPSCRVLAPARLSGYRLAFNKRGADVSGKANILRHEHPDSQVHGAVFLISREEKSALDRAEGGYRVEHHLVDAGTIQHEVFTYVAREEFLDDTLHPYHWYHALVLAGARYHGLPEDYLHSLRATRVTPDRNPDRARRNQDLLQSLLMPPV